MKISVTTLFDCADTGVTGHYRPSAVPFTDRTGTEIRDQAQWNQSRNRQRNWETLQQVIGLRSQIESYTSPERKQHQWKFEISVERSDVFGQDLVDLRRDCEGVPMIVGLTETAGVLPRLTTQGNQQNIWFETINS